MDDEGLHVMDCKDRAVDDTVRIRRGLGGALGSKMESIVALEMWSSSKICFFLMVYCSPQLSSQ